MQTSLEDYLALATPPLLDGLMTPPSMMRMRRTAATLLPSSDFGFECRLSGEDETVDLCARILAADGTRAAYGGLHTAAQLPVALLAHPAWGRVRRLCRWWRDAEQQSVPALKDMWLEIDDVELGADTPVPCIYAQPAPGDTLAATVSRVLGILCDRKRLPESCVRCLRPGSPNVLTQVGAMLGRERAPLRLGIKTRPDAVITYLRHIGWPGDMEALEHLMSAVSPLLSGVGLALDLDDSISPKVGIECIVIGSAAAERIAKLLAKLCDLGACSRQRADWLLRWPGMTSPESVECAWPRNLVAAASRRGARSLFLRRVNHIKVVQQPATSIKAKAYFGLTHRWAQA